MGGTGSRSEDEEPPLELPGALEVGTANALAFAALLPALRWIEAQGVASLHARCAEQAALLRAGLGELPGVRVFGAGAPGDLGVISFVVEGWEPGELAMTLDAAAGACLRAGLHCAPRAHRRLGTLPRGTLRASLGPLAPPGAVGELLEVLSAVLT